VHDHTCRSTSLHGHPANYGQGVRIDERDWNAQAQVDIARRVEKRAGSVHRKVYRLSRYRHRPDDGVGSRINDGDGAASVEPRLPIACEVWPGNTADVTRVIVM
jgi:hypothetical protein